jgi:hypothetical protein
MMMVKSCNGPKKRNQDRTASAVFGFKPTRKEALKGDSMGQWHSKLLTPIRAAEHFRPLSVIKGVPSVLKIEMGLKCGRCLPRKLRNTVLMQHHDNSRASLEGRKRGAFWAFA